MKISNIGKLKVKEGKMLFQRLGPINGQVQKHRRNDPVPARRGVWAFPWPYADSFFFFHKWADLLPKRLNPGGKWAERDNFSWSDFAENKSEEEMELFWKERDAAIREIVRRNPVKTFYASGPIYSRIKPKKVDLSSPWYRYDNVRDFANMVNRSLLINIRVDGKYLGTIPFSHDHLEVFIPM